MTTALNSLGSAQPPGPDLGEILGHKRRACEALDPDYPDKLPEQVLNYLWAEHSSAMQHVIFIDLLFEAKALKDGKDERPGFAGFVAFRKSPAPFCDNHLNQYLGLLQRILEERRTVGSHAVFQHSLPRYHDGNPETSDELQRWRGSGPPVGEYYLRATLRKVVPASTVSFACSSWKECFSSQLLTSNQPLPSHSGDDSPFYIKSGVESYVAWQLQSSSFRIHESWNLFRERLEAWLVSSFPDTTTSEDHLDGQVWGIPIALATNDDAAVGGLFIGFCGSGEELTSQIQDLCRAIATASFRVNMHHRALEAVKAAEKTAEIADFSAEQWASLRTRLGEVCKDIRSKFEDAVRTEDTKPDCAHHFPCGGLEDNSAATDSLRTNFVQSATGILKNIRAGSKNRWFDPRRLTPWCWNSNRETDAWAYPPLRALAQVDGEGHDLSTFFSSLSKTLKSYSVAHQIEFVWDFDEDDLKHNYLWFNAAALGRALEILLNGFFEFLIAANSHEVLFQGKRKFKVKIEEFKTLPTETGLLLDITQVLCADARFSTVYKEGVAKAGEPTVYKFLAVPESAQNPEDKIGKFWQFLRNAGMTKKDYSADGATLQVRIGAKERFPGVWEPQ